jgi:hypothetical protein
MKEALWYKSDGLPCRGFLLTRLTWSVMIMASPGFISLRAPPPFVVVSSCWRRREKKIRLTCCVGRYEDAAAESMRNAREKGHLEQGNAFISVDSPCKGDNLLSSRKSAQDQLARVSRDGGFHHVRDVIVWNVLYSGLCERGKKVREETNLLRLESVRELSQSTPQHNSNLC